MSASEDHQPWYRELNGYHWFVLVVCTLGWLFDCLDQQLFNMARRLAMLELSPAGGSVDTYSAWATAMLLVGWATGGIVFGILGDRIGRARTMVWTILAYSVFTGLTAFSRGVYDFIAYRFLTGLGVGGQFAVGVSLVAEVMPDRARPHALGMLQAFSAVGNITAGALGIGFGYLATQQILPSAWRGLFAIGILPALLVILVMTRLKEPERWQKTVAQVGAKRAGSLAEMFGTPQWRRNAIVGIILASAGVIGLWAIGVFSNDLVQLFFRQRYRQAGNAEADQQLLRLVLHYPQTLPRVAERLAAEQLRPRNLLSPDEATRDAEQVFTAALGLHQQGQTVSIDAVLAALDQPQPGRPAQSPLDRDRRTKYLEGSPPPPGQLEALLDQIVTREKELSGKLMTMGGYNLMLFNIGAFFGIYLFKHVTQRIGRRWTFAIFFLAAMIVTAFVFYALDDVWDILWMTPLMGACQLAVFGGYAIYFPELFPTRMRATGTSMCYNIARYLAATGPLGLSWLTTGVFAGFAPPLNLRYAGMTMCLVFLAGIAVLPLAPETKDQPLPE